MISLFEQLPTSSRIKRHLIGEKADWGYTEHLLADIRDLQLQGTFFGMLAAQSGFSKPSDWTKALQKVPTAPLRPGDEKPEIEFATKDELRMLFGGRKPRGRRQ